MVWGLKSGERERERERERGEREESDERVMISSECRHTLVTSARAENTSKLLLQ